MVGARGKKRETERGREEERHLVASNQKSTATVKSMHLLQTIK